MSVNKVALVGATGNLGPAILKALLDNGFEVTVLTREGSSSTDSLASHRNQKIVKVNFDDIDSITSALKGIDAVVSNVASHALLSQIKIIDAAVAAGVKRFLPSDFGSDYDVEVNKTVPFNAPKGQVQDHVKEAANANPNFSYTSVYSGPFLDWCLQMKIFVDLQEHKATLWDGGDTKISTSTLATVGKAVVGVFKNLEATKNKAIRICDTTITQKDMIAIVKEIDGKEWTTTPGSTDECYKIGLDEMKKPEPNMMVMVLNQLFRVIFNKDHGPDMEGKLDNDMVGVKKMSDEEVKAVIKSNMA